CPFSAVAGQSSLAAGVSMAQLLGWAGSQGFVASGALSTCSNVAQNQRSGSAPGRWFFWVMCMANSPSSTGAQICTSVFPLGCITSLAGTVSIAFMMKKRFAFAACLVGSRMRQAALISIAPGDELSAGPYGKSIADGPLPWAFTNAAWP